MPKHVMSYDGRVLGGYRHNIDDPWQGAPPWAIELHEQLRTLNKEPSANTHDGKNVNSARPALVGDSGYETGKDQVVVTYQDGTTKTVLRSEVKATAGYGNPREPGPIGAAQSSNAPRQVQGTLGPGAPNPPYNPNPVV